MMREMWYTKKYAGIEGDSIYDIYQGKNAFLNEYTWAEKNIIQAQKDGICDFGIRRGAPPLRPGQHRKRPIWFMPGGFSLSCPQ